MMDDDEQPKRKTAISDLPMSHSRVLSLLENLFPRTGVQILHDLTGVPTRSTARWFEGKVRVPPTILEKLIVQRKIQREFGDEIENLVGKYADKGAFRVVLRSELLKQANTDWIHEEDESEKM